MNEQANLGCGLIVIIILGIILASISGCFKFTNKHVFGNKQYFDFNQHFNTAYIQMPDGTSKKLIISKWNDYDQSDSIQIIDNTGKVYYTHLTRVILCEE